MDNGKRQWDALCATLDKSYSALINTILFFVNQEKYAICTLFSIIQIYYLKKLVYKLTTQLWNA